MARKKKKMPAWTHGPMYAGIRVAICAMLAGELRVTIEAARRFGRSFGGARFNRTRLERARTNLRVAFPDWDEARIDEHALASYEHLCMLGVEAAAAPTLLSHHAWRRHITIGKIDRAVDYLIGGRPCVLITGHCGNWELLGYSVSLLGFPMHALYRPLDMKPLDRWARQSRGAHGLTLVDKFGAVRELPTLMASGAPLGFVADQNGGDRGLFVPFFNRLTSTYKSIGLLALQFDATVLCGVARRVAREEVIAGRDRHGLDEAGLGYMFDYTDHIVPEDWADQPDPLYYLTARYRRAIEKMVRNAPEQYLWMHRIWRSRPRHERLGRPFPRSLRDKLAALPWIDDDDIARIEAHSERDTRTLAETGQTRLS
jgi:KDO2-lipid IV(A) lauroyltransferase